MVDKKGFGVYKQPTRCWFTEWYCDYKGSCDNCPDKPTAEERNGNPPPVDASPNCPDVTKAGGELDREDGEYCWTCYDCGEEIYDDIPMGGWIICDKCHNKEKPSDCTEVTDDRRGHDDTK